MSGAHESKRVAVVGGGLSGLACAWHLAQAGYSVHLFEAAPQLGGRARPVARYPLAPFHGEAQFLDNGPHLILGAYRQFLSLIYRADGARHHTPPQFDEWLRHFFLISPFLYVGEKFTINLPALVPHHGMRWLGQVARGARGFSWHEIGSLWRLALSLKCDRDEGESDKSQESVAQWLTRLAIAPALASDVLVPLCLSALNTEPEMASAACFRTLLRRIFLERTPRAGDADAMRTSTLVSPWTMLWPRCDFATLYINPLQEGIEKNGGVIHHHHRLRALAPPISPEEGWRLIFHHHHEHNTTYRQVVLATPIWQTTKIIDSSPEAQHLANTNLLRLMATSPTRPIANVAFWCDALQTNVDEGLMRQELMAAMPILRHQRHQGYTLLWLNGWARDDNETVHGIPRVALTAIMSAQFPPAVEEFATSALMALPLSSALKHALTHKKPTAIVEKQATFSADVNWRLAMKEMGEEGERGEKSGLKSSSVGAELLAQPIMSASGAGACGVWLASDWGAPPYPSTLESCAISAEATAQSLISAWS